MNCKKDKHQNDAYDDPIEHRPINTCRWYLFWLWPYVSVCLCRCVIAFLSPFSFCAILFALDPSHACMHAHTHTHPSILKRMGDRIK